MLDKIKQTSRTILFEEINPEKDSLTTILSENTGTETITDEVNQKLNDELAVNSFDEFLNKFKPCVYYSMGQNLQINYSVQKPENLPEELINKIELTKEHSVIKMLINLIDNKKSNAQENYKFDYQTIIDALSPKKTVEDLKQKRKELNYLLKEYNKLEDGNVKKDEIGEKLDNSLNKISILYNNPIALLPIAIEDTKRKIESTKKTTESGENSKLLGTGYKMDFDEKGSLVAVKLLPQTNTIQEKKVVSNQLLLPAIIKEDYEEEVKEKNNFALTLIINTLAPANLIQSEINLEEEQEKYDQYISVYENNLNNFIKQIKPLLQKIMGVYLFFAQCDIEKGKPNLFITNNKFEMTANNKDIMNKYFKYTNQGKNYESTFWFGVIPNIGFNEENTGKSGKSKYAGVKETAKKETNSITQMKTFLNEILSPYRIQTFFNFESRKETSFDFIAANGIQNFIEKSENLIGSEYLISCFPNFTIVPDDKFIVNIDEETKSETLGGIYIDASYVAAGIVAGYQIPLYLEKIFGKTKVEKNLPGVRLNIEENDNNKKIKTTLGKEISGFTKSIEDEINRDCFGFVFSSDYDKISVMKARSLKKKDKGNFEEIYKTTTSNYIRRYLEIITEKNSEKIIKFFDAKNSKSSISELLSKKESINGIFQAQDKIDYTEGNLNINYKGEEKIIEIEINNN